MSSDVNKWHDVMQNLGQFSVLLTFLYAKAVKMVNWNMCDKQIITWGLGYHPQYQPLTIISLRAKALRLIIRSQVILQAITKTPCDNLLLCYIWFWTATGQQLTIIINLAQ